MAEETKREQIIAALREGALNTRDLSMMLSMSEREVKGHLEFVRKSVEGGGERFVVTPASCKGCGFSFDDRKKAKAPSRCPKCKAQRIEPPRYAVQ